MRRSQSLVEDLLGKMADVCSMCSRKRDTLEQELLSSESPRSHGSSLTPGVSGSPVGGSSGPVRIRHHSDDARSRTSADSAEDDGSGKKSLMPMQAIGEKGRGGGGKWKKIQRKSLKLKGMFKRGRSGGDLIEPESGTPSGGESFRGSDSSPSTSAKDKASLSEASRSRRNDVMVELYETEKLYVEELGAILRGYYETFDEYVARKEIPSSLARSKSKLFGNLKEIHEFHCDTFLKELEMCRNTPSLVGQCFVKRREEFQLYSQYCQNKPQSDRVLAKLGGAHPYLRECQSCLNQQLPLGAYLLKPVQRITKYQLLLKEMMRYIGSDESGSAELHEALQCMLGVLKQVNDLMHQVAITGFQGKLSDLGKLMMQGQLVVSAKKFSTKARHVFLYERALLFCKRKEEAGKKSIYAYKFHIPVEQLNTGCENCKGDPRRFEVTLSRKQLTTTGTTAGADSSGLSGGTTPRRGSTLPRIGSGSSGGPSSHSPLGMFSGSVGGGSSSLCESYSLQAHSKAAKDEWLVQLRAAMLLQLDHSDPVCTAGGSANSRLSADESSLSPLLPFGAPQSERAPVHSTASESDSCGPSASNASSTGGGADADSKEVRFNFDSTGASAASGGYTSPSGAQGSMDCLSDSTPAQRGISGQNVKDESTDSASSAESGVESEPTTEAFTSHMGRQPLSEGLQSAPSPVACSNVKAADDKERKAPDNVTRKQRAMAMSHSSGPSYNADEEWSSGEGTTDSEGEVVTKETPASSAGSTDTSCSAIGNGDAASPKRLYVVCEDFSSQDNDLLLSPGDIVEEMRTAADWMMVRIPGTHVTGWVPSSELSPQPADANANPSGSAAPPMVYV